MKLTAENYHSPEANLAYMSVSQYKEWIKCEAATLATLRGEWEPDNKEALLVGGYVHAYFESPDAFQAYLDKNTDFIFKKRGDGKYSAFEKADEMIDCLKNDPKAMFYLQGKKEQIITLEMFGVPWKFKIDVLNEQLNYLLELKTAKNITEGGWVKQDGKNVKVSFVEEWNYLTQAAIYAEGERLYRGGENWRDFFMVAVTKEDPPDHDIINLTDQARFASELEKVQQNLPRIMFVKSGMESPRRCGTCKYCRATKKVDRIIHYSELMPA